MELLQNLLIRFAAYGDGTYGTDKYGVEESGGGGIGGLLPKTGAEMILAGLLLAASIGCVLYVYFRRHQLRQAFRR